VRVELPEGALPWQGAIDEQILRRRGQYTAGVEFIAGTFGALEPFIWEGDALLLVLGGVAASDLPLHTFKAAREIWNRVRTELNLPVRLAAHVGRVHAGAAPGTVTGSDVEACNELAANAPIGTIVASEELALALPETARRELTVLGNRAGEERLVYAFPRGAAATAAHALVADETPRVWDKFRSYAAGPDVRLVRYVGFRLHKREPPRLDIRDVFVPSEVELRRRADDDRRKGTALEDALMPAPWSAGRAAGATEGARGFRELYEKHRSVVVLGDPGSGKTTLLRWLAVVAASGSFALDSALGVAERLLPLPVSVGRLAEVRRGLGSEGVSVPAALARYFHDRSVHEDGTKLQDFLARELDRGRCLVLLDGLDEVKGEERQTIYQWLESFAAEYPHNRFVVSSRVVGYTGFQLPGDVAEAVLRPFDAAQVERYVRAFHRAYVRWETNAEPVTQTEADRLLEALRASPRLSALATNPFMLSALALIHRAEGKLPRHRVQAYEVFARALCETWAEARRLVAGETGAPVIEYEEEALPILGELALAMHEQYPTGVAPAEFVLGKLAGALGEQKGVSGAKAQRAAREFLRRAGEDVQILLERGAGEWGFLHLTFQEFFVAAGLHAKEAFEDVAFKHLFDPRWEEVLRLGVGYLALVQKRPTGAQRFVKKVLEHEEPEPRAWFTRVLRKQVPLAALLAAEAGEALPAALQERVAAALADWLTAMPPEVSKPLLGDLALTDFSDRVLAACRPLLKDSRARVRGRIAMALGALRNAKAADDVFSLIFDDDAEARTAAITALRAISVPGLLEKLRSKLTDDKPEHRAAAVEAIASFESKIPADLIRAALQDPHARVRAAAARTAPRLDRKEFFEVAHSLSHDESPSVREAIANSLVEYKTWEAVDAIVKESNPRDLIATLLRLIDIGIRYAQQDSTPTAEDRITNILSDTLSVASLKTAPVAQRITALCDAEPHRLKVVAASLYEDSEALDPLLERLPSSPPALRAVILDILGSLASERAVQACISALSDPDKEVQLSASQSLARHKRAEALPVLHQALQDTGRRQAAILALGKLGTSEVADHLIDVLENASPQEEGTVLGVLTSIASNHHVDRLEKLLRTREPYSSAHEVFMRTLWEIAEREARRSPTPDG
jgi:HEAT repeat protein